MARNFNMDYVNIPKAPPPRPLSNSDKKLLRLVLLSFGLLCILQATINVSLRVYLYYYEPDMNITELDGTSRTNITDQKRADFDQYLRNDWLYFNTSLYYISTVKKTWQKSRMFCLSKDADLMVINSRNEQEFTRKFHRFTWIGLKKHTTEGWMWVDGTPLTTSFWGHGEPNQGDLENCVEVRFFKMRDTWNDIKCDEENYWICEKIMTF